MPKLFEENVVEPMNDIDEVTMKETDVPRREHCDTSNCQEEHVVGSGEIAT